MSDEPTRLKRFIADQEEAVQLALSMPDGSNPQRIDAVNVALSLAHSNAVGGDKVTTMAELLSNARQALRFLSGQD
ncbi:MAG TPA: hypothetical protein VFS41_11970 [Edaphobacter sp.]|nr:hypothetical protein [Edaphobacter sp.]